jgi:hypothetical protein
VREPGRKPAMDLKCPSGVLRCVNHDFQGAAMRLLLLIIVIVLLIGSVPVYPYSAGWGYYPSGGLGILLIILLLFLFARRR